MGSLGYLGYSGFRVSGGEFRVIWDFPNIRVADFGLLLIRILLFKVLDQGPLFSETPI